jgi:hypothetical protein
MKKIHGWLILFIGYAFGLLGLTILLAYLSNFVNIIDANPFVILVFACTLALNLIGAYVIHRSLD